MSLKDWFDKRKEQQILARDTDVKIDDAISKLWVVCFNCNQQMLKKDLETNQNVCPHCDYHFRIGAFERINEIFDEDTFSQMHANVEGCDPLEFCDTEPYCQRQIRAKAKTNLNEAVITGIGNISGYKIAAAIMDFNYMGGSMGSVVGEKVTRMAEEALKQRIPFIVFTSSGGARMQESALSLMQMAKTSCAIARLNEEKILYITVLTEPTFGGVTASFGTLGDIIVAEKGARIGFAGRRVIEQTIRQKLPSDFQTAEYLLKYGQIDVVSTRKDLKQTLSNILSMHIN